MRALFRLVEMLLLAAGLVALSRIGRLFHDGADLDALLTGAVGLLCLLLPTRGVGA